MMNLAPSTGKLENYQVVTDVQSLNDLKRTAREDQAAAIKPVAQQFEALFVQEILKQSRNVKLDDGWLDGDQADFYRGWSDEQLAQSISAKGGLGLADKIVEQLTPKHPTIKASEYENYMNEQKIKNVSEEKPQKLFSTKDNLAFRGL